MKCEDCSHAEMCKWIDELEGRGCDFGEPCDDAISRKWLMRKATERFYTTNYFNHITAMIEEAPSVTQKSGKWTLMYEPKNMAVCSECGKCSYMYQDKTSAFCPHCGAKMQESEDKE